MNERSERRRRVVVAGHQGQGEVVLEHVDDPDEGVREAVLGALVRLDMLTDTQLQAAFTDPSGRVRRRAAVIAAERPRIELLPLLLDDDPTVVEVAAWA